MYNQNGHLTDETILKLCDNTLTEAEEVECYIHIASCDDCSTRYATCLENYALLSPPQDFLGNVQSQISKYEQENNYKGIIRRKKKEFRQYCFRVGFAVCATLIMTFVSEYVMEYIELNDSITKGNEMLSSFSQNIKEDFFDFSNIKEIFSKDKE